MNQERLKRLVIVDISSYIFRAYYAIRPLHAPDGTPVNAVNGVLSMLLKLLSTTRPTHVLLARDSRGKSFREDIYPEYKANRSAPPEDLVPQFALIEELIEKMELPNIAISGIEADDIIGSAVTQWRDQFDEILIASGDKDLMQFIDNKVKMLDSMKEITYGREEVHAKMGVYPEQVVDYLSIVGDASDNIPGVRGVGPKGALKLLGEYGSLEKILENRANLSSAKVIAAFTDHEKEALLSKVLITIKCDLELEESPESIEFKFHPNYELIDFLRKLGFRSMVDKLSDLAFNESVSNTPPVQAVVEAVIYESISIEAFPLHPTKIVIYQNLIATVENGKNLLATVTSDEMLVELIQRVKPEMIITDDSKRVYKLIDIQRVFDLSQAHFILNPEGRHDLSTITERTTAEEITVTALTKFGEIHQALKDKDLLKIYETIDGPMLQVLSKMEKLGVALNPGHLALLEKEFSHALDGIEKEVSVIAGESLNLKSPKQVSHLLFDILGFPVIRKTKTGASTDSDVLEELMALNKNDIPELLLKHRELEKLLSTYVTVLPTLVNPNTNRLHTNYTQNVAQTGRLSSINPNLQNIPIRSENGRRIRKAFIAKPGMLLLSADYTQVELRLLAHFSADPTMVNAFLKGEDIHAQTAAEVSGIPLSEITKEERSKAKAVNFGLMYGQSSFGLSESLHINRHDAKEYITRYFEKFGAVKAYLDGLKTFCEQHGYSQTHFGRKRFLPNINSSNRTIKSQAERVAVNSPIQGTAADIIKLAMIAIDKEITARDLNSRMILQVHDELIFEVPEEELSTMKELVRSKMESIVQLSIPLTVDMGVGVNWFDLK